MDKYFMISTLREVPFVMLFFFFLVGKQGSYVKRIFFVGFVK